MRSRPKIWRAIQKATDAASLPEVADSLAYFGATYGIERLFIGEILLGRTRPEVVVLLDTMEDWSRHYVGNGLPIDAILDFMIAQTRPMLWSEIVPPHGLTPEQEAYLTKYKTMGFVDGVSMPVWGPNGYFALVAAGSTRPLDLSDAERDSFQLLTLIALAKCRLLHYGTQRPIEERPITPREAEVLYWALEGKTDEEIATIIGLGRTTVKFHISNAIAKLGSTNRITAAVKALKSGLLLGPMNRNAVVVRATPSAA